MTVATAAGGRTLAAVDDHRFSTMDETSRQYARVAAGLLEAPIGAIRVAREGAAVVYESGTYSESPRFESIPDSAKGGSDAASSPLPEGVAACLSAPLVGRSGQVLGTIWAADTLPREWTTEDSDRLRALAATVAEDLEARAVEQPTTGAAPTGAVTDFVNAAMGLLQNRGAGSSSAPQADETVEALQTALEELRTSVEELQLMNEELHATRCMVEVEREHYRELFECVPYPYLITDRDGVLREANDAAATLLGARRSFLIGKPLAVFVPEEGRTGFRKRLRDLRAGGRMEWPLQLVPRGRAPKPLMCAASAARSQESDAERIYWLFQEVPGQESGSQSPNGVAASEAADAGVAKSQDFEELIAQATLRAGVPVVEQLRDLIAGAHDMGSLQVGQRLPSIRAIADRFGVTSYAALQAYASLEAEGVVERRERSGVYVAPVDWPVPPRLPETAEWLATVLTQACEHQVRIPHLPDLVRRWTNSVAIKCACVESSEDSVVALTHELSSRFGVTAVPVAIGDILGPDGNPRRTSALPAAIHEAQLMVTTPFHASQIRAIAESTGKPLLVATLNREIVDAVEAHLTDHDLTVVCVDQASGERLRNLQGGAYRDRIRVVLADELESAGLDRTQPVLLTLAARQRLNGASLRLIAPPTPSFSLEFARKVSGTLLRLNIDGGRG